MRSYVTQGFADALASGSARDFVTSRANEFAVQQTHKGPTAAEAEQEAGAAAACGMCMKTDGKTKLKACSNCKMVYYCSRECQQQHWSAHKHNCKKWKAARQQRQTTTASNDSVPRAKGESQTTPATKNKLKKPKEDPDKAWTSDDVKSSLDAVNQSDAGKHQDSTQT